jgi:hypothetical protein
MIPSDEQILNVRDANVGHRPPLGFAAPSEAPASIFQTANDCFFGAIEKCGHSYHLMSRRRRPIRGNRRTIFKTKQSRFCSKGGLKPGHDSWTLCIQTSITSLSNHDPIRLKPVVIE